MKRLSVIVVVILIVAMVGCLAAFGVQAMSGKGSTAKVAPSDQGIPGLVDLGSDGWYRAGSVKVVTFTPDARPRATATPGGTK